MMRSLIRRDAAKKNSSGALRLVAALLALVLTVGMLAMPAAADTEPTDAPTEGWSDDLFGFSGTPQADGPDEGEPTPAPTPDPKSSISGFLKKVVITDEEGNTVEPGGIVYMGDNYTIHLEFGEDGVNSDQFTLDEKGNLYFQLPEVFKTTPRQEKLTITVTDETGKEQTVDLGTVDVDKYGLVTINIDEDKREQFEAWKNLALSFDIMATAQELAEGGDNDFTFGAAGQDFHFQLSPQPSVSVDKAGTYAEDEDKKGGRLEYTVTTKVLKGNAKDVVFEDVFTPPQTDAFDLQMVKGDDGKRAVTVTVMRDGESYELGPEDYEVVEAEPNPENPGEQTFQVKLKGEWDSLKEGDEVTLAYQYNVAYNSGSVDTFWGNAVNVVTVTGNTPIEDPAGQGKVTDVPFEEDKSSNVEIQVTPPGDGIIFKTQEYSEADHKLHYTLYTLVPKGTWNPFYIHDDMTVDFGGKRYNLQEFKEGGRVSGLKVSAVDVENGVPGDWSDSIDEQRRKSLEELKKSAHELAGYNHFGYDFNFDSPAGYDSESVENYICLWLNNNLEIVFGEWERGDTGPWGNWNYPKDRLIITEYDLDMSDDKGPLELLDTSDYHTSLKKSASEVLLAGIKNVVHMRFDGYYPGYSVFFNNAERMNKTGRVRQEGKDVFIDYTVTMNLTDETVRKYFRDFQKDWVDSPIPKSEGENYNWSYDNGNMQAVFYDKLPDGWTYVDGTLYATVLDIFGNLKEYKDITQMDGDAPGPLDDKGNIKAPLAYFRGPIEPIDLFNAFVDNDNYNKELAFHYTLQATSEWLKQNATSYDKSVPIKNHAEIKDRNSKHWEADNTVRYIPSKLTKVAENMGDGTLKFTLEVNEKEEQISGGKTLTVKDTSQNLQILEDTIEVKDKDGNAVPFGKGTQENGQFELYVPDGMHLIITYRAVIIGSGSVQISNTASINGVNNSDATFTKTLDVQDMSSGGSASTYKMAVLKLDADDKTTPLAGAKFDCYIVRPEDSTLAANAEFTIGGKTYHGYHNEKMHLITGADGKGTVTENIYPNNYYIFVETKAPDGYELDETPILVYFGQNKPNDANAKQVVPGVDLSRLVVYDTPVKKLQVIKKDAGAKSALGGAQFELWKGRRPDPVTEDKGPLYSGTSQANDGLIAWTKTGAEPGAAATIDLQLAPGDYYLYETAAPDGYSLLKDPVTFKVDADGKISATGLPEGSLQTLSDGTVQLTVLNEGYYVLPESGGAGTLGIYALGGALMLTAALALVCRRRRSARR